MVPVVAVPGFSFLELQIFTIPIECAFRFGGAEPGHSALTNSGPTFSTLGAKSGSPQCHVLMGIL
jgi:hypothetical protein